MSKVILSYIQFFSQTEANGGELVTE